MQNSQQIFKLHSEYQPTGDQPQAIEKLVKGFQEGNQCETLLGVTGSGKTFTMANVIAQLNKPTLIIAHNKTLAAQLYGEFKEFFPENAVEYFVSYYDYYQPEAYIPHTDTYIEKDASTNEEIDRLRLSATCALLERRDVIVVSSVSCIYGLGEPDDFARMMISLRTGMTMDRDELLRRLVEDRYERNDVAFQRNVFRVRGDTVELYPAYYKDRAIRVEFFGDEIDRISDINVVTGAPIRTLSHVALYPASHYVTTHEKMERAISETYRRREVQLKYNEEHGIVPQTIKKDVREILEISTREHTEKMGKGKKRMSQTELRATIEKLTAEMKNAAQILEFEHAAYLRDKIKKLKEQYTANPNLKIMKDAQESSGNKGRKKR